MMQTSEVARRDGEVVESNLVPAPWNELFSNPEWLVHQIVVRATYGMVVIVLIAHLLVWLWRPWLG